MLLTKEQILTVQDLKFKDVSVPEWGGDVRVWELTGEERDKFEAMLFTGVGEQRKIDQTNFRARLCAFAIGDEQGNRMFTPDEIKALGRKSAIALGRVFDAAQSLSGLDDASEKKAKKPSGGESTEGSTSDSQPT